jgi:hypothetical protein
MPYAEATFTRITPESGGVVQPGHTDRTAVL